MRSKNRKSSGGMVDVSEKEISKRLAKATAQIKMSPSAFQQLITYGSPKGDVFETAKVAGIMAAKATSTLIPLCHPLAINKVNIKFEKDPAKYSIKIQSEVVCQGRTGVEMEALVAASAAALTIYDMMKFLDPAMVISEVKLLYKSGGKSGEYIRKSSG